MGRRGASRAPFPSKTTGPLRGWQMKRTKEEFNKLKKRTPEELEEEIDTIIIGIENRYRPLKEQANQYGEVIGNVFFTDEQLVKLKTFESKRNSFYDELEQKLRPELFFKVVCKIEDGFLYLAEDKDPMHETVKLYKDAKKRIENKIEKENEKLVDKDPYFGKKLKTGYEILFPIRLSYHHLDNPTPPKKGSPNKNQSILIKQLSELLRSYLPKDADREKKIAQILLYFYDLDLDPRSIISHYL